MEKILVYCAQNGISVDELMSEYKEKQKIIKDNKTYVNFPMPQGLDERVTDVYRHANEYVQCVASHLCHRCKRECKPMQGDKWLWNDCLVSRISMIMLSHVLLVQDEVKVDLIRQILQYSPHLVHTIKWRSGRFTLPS